MRHELDDDSFLKVWAYAKAFNLNSISENAELKQNARIAYRASYPLLIWSHELSKTNRHINSSSLLLKEAVSDISTSFFLFIQGFYKPSLFILRGGIDNFIRFFYLISIGNNASKKTDSMFAELKAHYYQRERIIHSAIVKTYNIYSDLSTCIHGDFRYMEMMEGLADYPKYDKHKAELFIEKNKSICSIFNFILLFHHKTEFSHFHFKLKDAIVASLNKTQKKAIFGL